MNKRSTTLYSALITIAAILLSTLAIGSTSASAKVFSNSGNNVITHQNCTAGGSCTLSSSNVITQQPGSSTTPSPSSCPGGVTLLSLSAVGSGLLTGSLVCASGILVNGATITFTGTGVPHNPNFVATTNDGEYFMSFSPPTTPGTYTAQAHFAGSPTLNPSDSQTQTFTIP